jgi:phosphoserine/homoserine phosphotransferase
MIFALDLEGCLAPEIWPALGTQFHVPEFSLTTRDVADFDELMQKRIAAARRASLRLADLQVIAHAVEPYLGAREFVARLRALGNVIIISDTFHEFADPIAARLGGVNLFANRFEVDASGVVAGIKLRIRGRKDRLVTGFKTAGFKVAAMGDSMNDFSLLESCDFPLMYRPVESLRAKFPGAPEAVNLDEALAFFEDARRRNDEESEG